MEINAILFPSGDHVGCKLVVPLSVIILGFEVYYLILFINNSYPLFKLFLYSSYNSLPEIPIAFLIALFTENSIGEDKFIRISFNFSEPYDKAINRHNLYPEL